MNTRFVSRPFATVALLITFTSLSTALGQAPARPARGGPRPPQVISPEVSPDRKITYRIHAPNAELVRVTGGDLPEIGRGVEMTKGTNDVWEVTLGPVNPGAYRYRFSVDNLAVIDPRNPATSESNENTWSLVYVPGAAFMDTQDVPHGAVAEVTYWSSTLNRFRRLHVYTPPGYESGQGTFPIFYLLHGAFDSDDSWSSVGRAGFILDNLMAAGDAVPMVVVMPHGHTGPFRFGRRLGGEFEREFVQDIMPLVEKRYRVRPDRKHRAIAGLSMGGAHTLNIGVPHLEKFGYLGVFSSGVFGIDRPGGENAGPSWEETHQQALDNPKLKEGLELVWFATGKDDFLVRTSRATVEMLQKHGFEVTYQETEGGHTWINWREYLHEFASQLFSE